MLVTIKKCKFYITKTKFYRFIIKLKKLSIDPKKINDRVYRESRVPQHTAWSLCIKNFKQQQHHLIEFEYTSSRQLKLLLIYLTVKSFSSKP